MKKLLIATIAFSATSSVVFGIQFQQAPAPEYSQVETHSPLESSPSKQVEEKIPPKEEPSVAQTIELPVARAEENPEARHPARLLVPSINLDVPIVDVGINEKGEMDVPSGKTDNVGWYQYGTMPSDPGSAVLAAHVTAAFKRLKEVPAGSDIYIVTRSGRKLHFVVEERAIYPLAEVPRERLFLGDKTPRLNLITCAGSYVRRLGTYDHRLILYTKFVPETR